MHKTALALAGRFARLVMIGGLFVLGSCTENLTSVSGKPYTPSQLTQLLSAGFYETLENEYVNLALFETDFMNSPDQAARFSAKAQQAQKRESVAPDNPGDHEIPRFAQEDLTQAYAMLNDALENLYTEENGALLAMAQTRYDCWLTHQEMLPEKSAYIACKKGFYDTLSLLNIPESDIAGHPVYFEKNSIELDTQAKQTIDSFTTRHRDREFLEITLRGFTDREGNKEANRVLSMRRAIAVKNMLGQQGFDLDNIAISAEGQARGKDPAKSRRVEIHTWPRYVARDKEGLRVLPEWVHSGEF